MIINKHGSIKNYRYVWHVSMGFLIRPQCFYNLSIGAMPIQPSCPRKYLNMENIEPAESGRPANGLPDNFWLPSRDHVSSRQNEDTLYLIKVFDDTRRNNKWGQMLDFLRAERRFNEEATTGCGDISIVPRGDISQKFFLKCWNSTLRRRQTGSERPN